MIWGRIQEVVVLILKMVILWFDYYYLIMGFLMGFITSLRWNLWILMTKPWAEVSNILIDNSSRIV